MRLSTTIVSVLSSCGFFAPPQSSILFASWDQSEKNDAPDPDYCCGSHAHASRADRAPGTGRAFARDRHVCCEEAQESQGAQGRVFESRARHRPKRAEEIITAPAPRS